MNEVQLTKHNLPEFIKSIQDELEKNTVLIVSTKSADTGKWGMARLWRAWMKPTSDFMAANGIKQPLMISIEGKHYGTRPFDENDAHELFTRQWLGVDKDGIRLSWAKKSNNGMRAASRGERFDALRRHEEWAIMKGIILYKPRGSEYERLEQEQNS